MQSNDELEGRLSFSQTSRTQVMSRQMEATKRSKHTLWEVFLSMCCFYCLMNKELL